MRRARRAQKGADPLVRHQVPDCFWDTMTCALTQSTTCLGGIGGERGGQVGSTSPLHALARSFRIHMHRCHFKHTCGVRFHKNRLARATQILQKTHWLEGSTITNSLGDGPDAMRSFSTSQIGTHFSLFLRMNIGLALLLT